MNIIIRIFSRRINFLKSAWLVVLAAGFLNMIAAQGTPVNPHGNVSFRPYKVKPDKPQLENLGQHGSADNIHESRKMPDAIRLHPDNSISIPRPDIKKGQKVMPSKLLASQKNSKRYVIAAARRPDGVKPQAIHHAGFDRCAKKPGGSGRFGKTCGKIHARR
jgi:hypothetical protein